MKRREFIHACSAALATLAFHGIHPLNAAPQFSSNPFTLGVASGDPWPDGVVLWTRLAPDPLNGGGMAPEMIPVEWLVASDERMQDIVQRGSAMALPNLAHSVHAEVYGLQPDRWYWYQFVVGAGLNRIESPVGRTRTAPAAGAPIDQFRFAFASCQKYEEGFYTAYQWMAEEDLDLVIHLGDYIYEGAFKPGLPRQHQNEEARDLESYRNRYALYKTDPDLQRAHALFPWAVVPDDHEVEDDYASDFPTDPGELNFLERRAAGYQAYYEHMPLRATSIPSPGGIMLYRRLTFGNMVEFHMLDTRQYRSDQPCGEGEQAPCTERDSDAVTMMGGVQEKWLQDGLSASTARWNVIAQQIYMAPLDRDPGPGERFSMDKWDGYPAARSRLMAFLGDRQPSNPVVLTGDNHNNWVFDLKRDFRDPQSPIVGTEFVGTSITSNGNGSEQQEEFARLLAANPHVKFFNSHRGYVRCRLTASSWKTDFRTISYVDKPGAPIGTRATFVIENGRPGAVVSS
jgi:alkaline phosphatase D